MQRLWTFSEILLRCFLLWCLYEDIDFNTFQDTFWYYLLKSLPPVIPKYYQGKQPTHAGEGITLAILNPELHLLFSLHLSKVISPALTSSADYGSHYMLLLWPQLSCSKSTDVAFPSIFYMSYALILKGKQILWTDLVFNLWKNIRSNADKMCILLPLRLLISLKSYFVIS